LVALQWKPNLEIAKQAMNTTDNSPMDDLESAVLISVTAKKIARCLQQLEKTPRSHPNVKALKGDYAGYYRY
jgi:hypothetical protein